MPSLRRNESRNKLGDAIRRIRKPKWCDNGFLVAAELMKDRTPFIRRFIDYPLWEYPTSYRVLIKDS